MKRNTLLYILIILLLIVNGYFITNQFVEKKGRKDRKHRTPRTMIAKELDFDEAQMAKFEALFEGHRNAIMESGKNIRALKDELFDLMFRDESLSGLRDSLLTEIGRHERTRDSAVYEHFRKVSDICTEAQKKKFRKMVRAAMHRRDRGPGPR